MDPWRSTTWRSIKGVRVINAPVQSFFFKLISACIFIPLYPSWLLLFIFKVCRIYNIIMMTKNALRLRVKCVDRINTFFIAFHFINFEGHITFLWKKKYFEAGGGRPLSRWRQPSYPKQDNIKYGQSYLSCCMRCNEIDPLKLQNKPKNLWRTWVNSTQIIYLGNVYWRGRKWNFKRVCFARFVTSLTIRGILCEEPRPTTDGTAPVCALS